MKTIKNYNIYIFISTFTRNIIDIYSVIYLYQKSFDIKEIIIIYAIVYFLGYFISWLSLTAGNKVGYKYILIISSLTTSVTFYILHKSNSIYLIALFLSLSTFTYHPIRHYYGMQLLKHKKEIGKTLIYIYIASLLSSYMAIKNMNAMCLIIISIIGIIPALFIKKEGSKIIKYHGSINYQKLKFFFFDQFKIIFIFLEPLYLYLIANKISYVGIFNILLTLSSIICVYLLSNKINIEKHYKYTNILFTVILIIKLNVYNKGLLLIIAILEGMGIKMNELVSTMNLYHDQELNEGYIIACEKIFCITRALILCIIYFLPLNLKMILYILLIGIFLLSFSYKKDPLTWGSSLYF